MWRHLQAVCWETKDSAGSNWHDICAGASQQACRKQSRTSVIDLMTPKWRLMAVTLNSYVWRTSCATCRMLHGSSVLQGCFSAAQHWRWSEHVGKATRELPDERSQSFGMWTTSLGAVSLSYATENRQERGEKSAGWPAAEGPGWTTALVHGGHQSNSWAMTFRQEVSISTRHNGPIWFHLTGSFCLNRRQFRAATSSAAVSEDEQLSFLRLCHISYRQQGVSEPQQAWTSCVEEAEDATRKTPKSLKSFNTLMVMFTFC